MLEVLLVLVVMAVLIVPVPVAPVEMAVPVVPVTMAVLDVLVVTGSSPSRANIVTTTAMTVLTATDPNKKRPIIANFLHLTDQQAGASFSSPPEPAIRMASQTGIVMTMASAGGVICSRLRWASLVRGGTRPGLGSLSFCN